MFYFSFLLQGPYVMLSVATKIFQELVEGVFYIHNMGIVHRDLKVSGAGRALTLMALCWCGVAELQQTARRGALPSLCS